MKFSPEEKANLIALIEIGAKAATQDKPLKESVGIQGMAVQLIEKINTPEEEPTPEVATE